MKRRVVVPAGLLLAACPAFGQIPIYTETFDNGVNAGGWTFGAPVEGIQPSGGSTGPYLRGDGIDTTIPFLRTGVGVTSAFTGNYRANHVITLGVRLNVFHTDFSIGSRPPAVILYSENGTPANPDDDWGAYAMSAGPLAPAGTWGDFTWWSIDTQQSSLPSGWAYIEFGPSVPPSRSWDGLVQNVDRLMFSFGDPSLFYIFQMWDVGADTVWIARTPLCYANCDWSTTPPFLNVLDFSCFISKFSSADSYANCDGSTSSPVLNVLDFVCFLNRFSAGCSTP